MAIKENVSEHQAMLNLDMLDHATLIGALLVARGTLTLEQKNSVIYQDAGFYDQAAVTLSELISAALENSGMNESK